MRLRMEHPTSLTASDDTGRTRLAGLLLPHGTGRTSAGPIDVDAATDLTVPELARIVLTMHHDRTQPVGRAAAIDPGDSGWEAVWELGRNPAARAAAQDIEDGLITGQSVELDDVVLDGQRLVSATLLGASLVTVPAFQDARVQIAATLGDAVTDPTPTPTTPESPPTIVAAAPRISATPRLTLDAAAAMIASVVRGDADASSLTAALSDATTEMTSLGRTMQPMWLGQLWEEAAWPRPHVDACDGPTRIEGSLNIQGWRWKTPLSVNKWTGDKADIPSNVPVAESATVQAQRWAGGVDIARELIDLGNGDVIRSLMAEAVNDYKRKTDLACLSDLLTAATPLTGGTKDSFTQAIVAVIRQLHLARHQISVIWVATDILDEEMLVTGQLRWPSGSLNIAGGDPLGVPVVADVDLPDGTVLGLSRGAAEFFETGPIRVSALDIARGGVDEAVFGYTATLAKQPAAIVKTTVLAPPPAG